MRDVNDKNNRPMKYTPKLIYCKECTDVVRLWEDTTTKCKCTKCSGELTNDGKRAVYRGPAVPIRFGYNFKNAVLAHNEGYVWNYDVEIPYPSDETFDLR